MPRCFSIAATRLTFQSSRRAEGFSQLLLDRAQVEGARRLARRVLLHRVEEARGHALHRYKHEYSLEEPVVVGIGIVLGALEGVTAQVEQQRHAQLSERLPPHTEGLAAVLEKDGLPTVIADGDDLA